MATTINRTTLNNDTGTPTAPNGDGTVLDNTFFQNAIYSAIDNLFTSAFTFGSTVSSAGFGAHVFSGGGSGGNTIQLRNTSAGTANFVAINLGNDASPTAGGIQTISTAFTTIGGIVQDGTQVFGTRPGGLNLLAMDVTGMIRFYTAGAFTERMRIHASGGISIGDTFDPGVAGLLRVNASGAHYFYSSTSTVVLSVWSSVAGSAGVSQIHLGNDASSICGYFQVLSATYPSSYYNIADSLGILATRAGGMSIVAAHASGTIRFYPGGNGAALATIGTSGEIYERGRSIPMGAWQDVAYNGTNFSASGGGTWTVQLGDQYAFRYCIVGDMMHIQFSLVATTHASAGNELFVLIPGGYTVVDYSVGVGFFSWPSGETCLLYALASTNTISIQHWPVVAWGSSSTNGQSIHGTMAVKVNV